MTHEYLEKIQRINLKRTLDKEQDKINKMFEEEGLTDRVLDKQIELNQKRNKHNISDKTNILHKRYVQ